MIPNNNLSVLPWYDQLRFQNHRKSYAYGNVYPLLTPSTRLLPNFFIRPHIENNIDDITVLLYDKAGELIRDLTTEMIELQILPYPDLEFDIIVYPGTIDLVTMLPTGEHYLLMDDGENTYYSEVFTVVPDISECLKISWFDQTSLQYDGGLIPYTDVDFTNVIYLQTELGKPEYKFEEKGEDRNGLFFPEEQISEKTFKFTFLAPEYLCDVMRLIRLSDFVVVEKWGKSYDVDTFLITPKWETQGDLASVEAEFDTNTVVKKIGSAINAPIPERGIYAHQYESEYE